MIYIIEGNEEIFIRRKIDEICGKDLSGVIRIDGTAKDLQPAQIVEACESNSLFSERCIVLVNEPYFLTKAVEEKEVKVLLDYVKDPLYDTELVFYTLNDNFISRSVVYKAISSNAQIFKLNSPQMKDFPSFLSQAVTESGLAIDRGSKEMLGSICRNSVTLLYRNLQILSLYPEKIDASVVEKLCTASDDTDSFELINAMTAGNVTRSIALSRRMNDGKSSFGLFSLLAGQLRFLYYVSYLSGEGNSRSDIMRLTQSREYRIIKAFEALSRLSQEKILSLLNDLSHLDTICRNDSSIDEQTRFELYILNLLRN